MKLWFYSHYFPPEGNAPATRTYDHCKRWAAAGHDVTVFTCVPNVPNGTPYEGYRNRWRAQEETIDGVRVVRVWTYLAANAGTLKRICNFVSYMFAAVFASLWRGRPDVVVATSPQFFCGWAGVLSSRLKRAPLVLEIRDIWPESILAVGAMRPGKLSRLLEWLEKAMYRSAAHIVAVGEGYRRNIQTKVDVAARSTVITNGVDLEQFAPREPSDEFRGEFNPHGKFVCSYVGTIGMAHGLEVVLQAARQLADAGRRDIGFLLVGDGARREGLQREAKEMGIDDLVVFTGRLPKERMPQVLASTDASLVHLKACDLFSTVIPSKIFETMAMGCPIIMGVRGEARDIVMQAGAGLEMEPGDADSLCGAVVRLADDAAFRERLSQAGRQGVATHYNRDVLAGRYLDLLQQVVGGETASGRLARTNPPASESS